MTSYAVEVIWENGWTFPIVRGFASRRAADFACRQLSREHPAFGVRLLAQGMEARVIEEPEDDSDNP